MQPTTQGFQAEQQACDYLCHQGLRFITKNFRCRTGEIDLIMQDKTVIVFIEVRYRRNTEYGDPLTSITSAKQRKIVRTATYYLTKHQLYDRISARFDVVAITANRQQTIAWVKNAFSIGNFD